MTCGDLLRIVLASRQQGFAKDRWFPCKRVLAAALLRIGVVWLADAFRQRYMQQSSKHTGFEDGRSEFVYSHSAFLQDFKCHWQRVFELQHFS